MKDSDFYYKLSSVSKSLSNLAYWLERFDDPAVCLHPRMVEENRRYIEEELGFLDRMLLTWGKGKP